MQTPLPQVGFVGLGAMGMPMAKSLLRAGLTVTAYDVRAAAVETCWPRTTIWHVTTGKNWSVMGFSPST